MTAAKRFFTGSKLHFDQALCELEIAQFSLKIFTCFLWKEQVDKHRFSKVFEKNVFWL